MFFYRETESTSTVITFTESFEYSGGWTGTILPPAIPNFDSPQYSLTESFDSSWDGI